jgi:hypothetical protein
MNRRTNIIRNSIVVALITILPAQAQTADTWQPQSTYLVDNMVEPANLIEPQGTAELQEKVLIKINEGLVSGWLSPVKSSQFKNQVNKINEQESWYRSFSKEIPVSITEKDTTLLNQLSQKLEPKPLLSVTPANALHADIDDLIAKALARNLISSSDAEKYYLRLAQIESNLENSKRNQAAGSDQKAVMNKDVSLLKSELMHKID